MTVNVKVRKLHPNAKLPTKAYPSDSGYDIYALHDITIPARRHIRSYSGIAFELPDGYEIQLRGRSGLAGKGITAHWGTIDTEYRGEVAAILYNHTDHDYTIQAGDRVCQVVVKPVLNVALTEVAELQASKRQEQGFGSSGR